MESIPEGASVALPRLPIDDRFDVSFADELARLESYNKHHYRPNTYLHKWWARRCGSTFRLILKHLVDDAGSRDYYEPGGLEGKLIVDPMMGGGTTLHEAIRMGANVVGLDLDPIPVLQARASLTDLPLETLESAFREFYRGLEAPLAPYYETNCPDCGSVAPLRYVLYGARRHCACGPAILVDSLVVRYRHGRPAASLCPCCHAVLEKGRTSNCQDRTGRPLLVEKSHRHCSHCGGEFQEDVSKPFYRRYVPLVIVGYCPGHGAFFKRPSADDRERLCLADSVREEMEFDGSAGLRVRRGPKSQDLLNRNVSCYTDLFSSRQLLYLHHALGLMPRFSGQVRLNLALLLSTSLEFNSLLCGYKGARRGDSPGAIRHTFSYHAYSFPYTALENNPLYPQKASGTLQKLFHDRLRRAREWAQQPRERNLSGRGPRFVPVEGEKDIGREVPDVTKLGCGNRRFFLCQGTAASLPLPDESADFIVTDPPYFDNVQYENLAEFFRVWLRRALPAETQATYEWHYDRAEAAVGPSLNGSKQFETVLAGIFRECVRVLKPSGRLIFTYHHWRASGWIALTRALRQARMSLVNHYEVHSENPTSVHVANLSALRHDSILVLAHGIEAGMKVWEQPSVVDKSDSRRFCHDCAELLGWMLARQLPQGELERIWRKLLD